MARKEKKGAKAVPKEKKQKLKRKNKKAAVQPEMAAIVQTQPEGYRRSSAGVPPLDAFDHLPKRRPPAYMQPGLWQEDPAEEAEAASGRNKKAAKRKTAKSKANTKTKATQHMAKNAADDGAPRVSSRKKKKNISPARRRWKRRVAAIMAIALLIVAGAWFSVTVLFKIEKYDLQGESPYTLQQVADAFGHPVGDNVYGFSVKNAEERICEQLPYIESVQIKRRLPSTILFVVQQAEEVYYLPWGQGFAVLSGGRKVLRFSDTEPESLLRIDGLSGLSVELGHTLTLTEEILALTDGRPLEASESVAQSLAQDASSAAQSTPDRDKDASADPTPEEKAAALLEEASAAQERLQALNLLLDALATHGLDEINWIDVGDPLIMKFRWQDRVTVIIGPKSGLDEKMEQAVKLLRDEILPVESGTLDMTYYLSTNRSYFAAE